MSRRAEIALAVTAALIVLSIVGTEIVAALVVAGCITATAVTVTRARVMNRASGPVDGILPWLQPAFAVCWLLLVVIGGHSVTVRSERLFNNIGIGGVISFTYFCAVAGFALVVMRSVVGDIRDTIIPPALVGLPLLAAFSWLWSPDYMYSFALGVQLVATAVLAWGTIELGVRSPAFIDGVVERFVRWWVWLAVVLTGLGVVFGGVYAPVGGQNLERFHWIGAHPNVAGYVTGTSILALLVAPASILKVPLFLRAAMLGVVCYGFYGAQARTAMVALGAALALVLLLTAMQSWLARYVTLPYVLAGALAGVFVFRDPLLGYFYRDQDSDGVSSGNGRSELWGDGFDLLRTPFDWALGLGYGQTHTVFLEGRPWATSAHSSVLGILVNLGIIGLALFAFWIVYTLVAVYRSRIFATPRGRVLVGYLAYVLVHSQASESTSNPGTSNAMIMFVGAVAIAVVRLRANGESSVLSPPLAADTEDQPEPLPVPGSRPEPTLAPVTTGEPRPDQVPPNGVVLAWPGRRDPDSSRSARAPVGLHVRLRPASGDRPGPSDKPRANRGP